MDRIQQLEEFLREDPNDPFNIYALALEQSKHDKLKARALFDTLFHSYPGYLPTYYTFAQLLIDLDEPEKVESVFKAGIHLAKKMNDNKSLKELSNAYSNWLFEQS